MTNANCFRLYAKAALNCFTCSRMMALILITGCRSNPATQTPVLTLLSPSSISLPAPREQGPMSLEEAIAARRSIRAFTDRQLTLEQIAQLLWAAQGITDSRGLRSAPSAGALYPLELYLVSADGFYRYQPDGHRLILLLDQDKRQALWELALKQDALRDAPAVFLFAAVYQRTADKYGERAERYVKLEAGHAAQNLLLQAVGLGLGALPIGAFYDDQLQTALSLPEDHEPLYLLAVGYPAE